jgi:GDP-L-fucose synthase
MKEKIYVAGHRGLVGSAILRALADRGHHQMIVRSRAEADLRERDAVVRVLDGERPSKVYVAAARVGGIHANSTFPAEFLRDNLLIQTNVIDASYRAGVQKLLFLGSSCIYPKNASQPMSESCLLSGPLEPTNEWYAIAKIAGIKMCQAYRRQYGFNAISAMPTNLYGPGDNFDLETSHVIPALIRKFCEATERRAAAVEIWGTGTPRREFLHVDDLASACLFLMDRYDGMEPINVGCGEDVSIAELAGLIAQMVGFRGELIFDRSKPDGTPRKLLDVSRIRELGWRPGISLHDGLRSTVSWYLANRDRRVDP